MKRKAPSPQPSSQTPPSSSRPIKAAHDALQAGKLDEAEALAQKVLEHFPNDFDGLHLLGVVWAKARRYESAFTLLDKAIALRPGNKEIQKNRRMFAAQCNRMQIREAVAIHQQGRLTEAEAIYRAVLQRDADNFDAIQLMGALAAQAGNHVRALKFLERALAIKPDYADAYNNRGVALKGLNRLEDALASYERAIALKLDYADAYNNRGIALRDLNRHEEALSSCEKAIALKPDYAEAYTNRGFVLKELKRLDEALSSYEQAIALKPDYAEAHWNLALARLLIGDFRRGWDRYEWRWRREDFEKKRHARVPPWLGEKPLAGKAILLWSEQGLGDTIQFCRYASSVAELGATVYLEVPQSLKSLLTGIAGVAQVFFRGESLPALDFQCPMLSLPLALDVTVSTLSGRPYLAAPTPKAWTKHLGDGKKIGVAWSGSSGNKNDANRSIPLSSFAVCLPASVTVICLQKEIRDFDRSTLARYPNIHLVTDSLQDFSDTAALIEALDLVVAVDTSVAHLAGAMGKEVWVLLPYVPDWRWLLDRKDSPWYDSATLFRQKTIGDWNSVLAEVGQRLCERYSGGQVTDSELSALPLVPRSAGR